MKKSLFTLALLSTVAVTTLSGSAFADTHGEQDWLAKERFQIRARLIDVAADGEGRVDGTNLRTDVRHAVTPELDITYFFNDNVSAELIAATSQHEVDAANLNLGEAWILPPTLTLQYHFSPEREFSPYVGAGINYSMFYGETEGNGFSDLDVKGGWGYALQAGFDYWLDDNWGLNFDVKYVDLDVDVKVVSGVNTLRATDVDLNPFIVGAGVSYRF